MLRQYETDIIQRWERYRDWEQRVAESEGDLAQFARGYEEWGIVQRANGEVTVREWVENGLEVALVGDFNGWDRTCHVCSRDKYSVFTLTVPPREDGTSAIPHGSQVKLWIRTKFGQELYRLSPWTKYATQVPNMGVGLQRLYVRPSSCRTYLSPWTTVPSTGLLPVPTSGDMATSTSQPA